MIYFDAAPTVQVIYDDPSSIWL